MPKYTKAELIGIRDALIAHREKFGSYPETYEVCSRALAKTRELLEQVSPPAGLKHAKAIVVVTHLDKWGLRILEGSEQGVIFGVYDAQGKRLVAGMRVTAEYAPADQFARIV